MLTVRRSPLPPIRQNIAKDWLNSAFTPVNPLRTAYSYYSDGKPIRMMYLRLDSQDNSQETYIVKYMDDGSVQAVFHYLASGGTGLVQMVRCLRHGR